jgi:hypothetical protein
MLSHDKAMLYKRRLKFRAAYLFSNDRDEALWLLLTA